MLGYQERVEAWLGKEDRLLERYAYWSTIFCGSPVLDRQLHASMGLSNGIWWRIMLNQLISECLTFFPQVT